MELSREVRQTLERAIVQSAGREIAGLLLESADGQQRVVLGPNLADEPGVVELPGWWRERIERWARASELTVRAFIHSHGTSLETSLEDEEGMRQSGLPWLIVWLRSGELDWREETRKSNEKVPLH
jgi:proteasome lid subunit RPN8/RPN11